MEEDLSSSLFDLISLAGNASLDELRARSSVDDVTLANTVASMVASGTVALSIKPETKVDQAFQGVIHLFGKPTGGELKEAASMDRDALKVAIKTVLENENAAASITATPTSKGFKRSF